MAAIRREVHQESDALGDERADRRIRQPDIRFQHAVGEACERLRGRVRMDVRERAGMPGVEGPEQVEGLSAAHLLDQQLPQFSILHHLRSTAHDIQSRAPQRRPPTLTGVGGGS